MKIICLRNELQLEVEQMYTIYWIAVTWWRDRIVTWHVGWGLLILITTLLSLLALRLMKVKIKYFWFVTWPTRKVSRDFLGGYLIVSLYYGPPAKLGVHRPCESGDITFFICRVQIKKYAISEFHVTLWVGSPHPKPPPY